MTGTLRVVHRRVSATKFKRQAFLQTSFSFILYVCVYREGLIAFPRIISLSSCSVVSASEKSLPGEERGGWVMRLPAMACGAAGINPEVAGMFYADSRGVAHRAKVKSEEQMRFVCKISEASFAAMSRLWET